MNTQIQKRVLIQELSRAALFSDAESIEIVTSCENTLIFKHDGKHIADICSVLKPRSKRFLPSDYIEAYRRAFDVISDLSDSVQINSYECSIHSLSAFVGLNSSVPVYKITDRKCVEVIISGIDITDLIDSNLFVGFPVIVKINGKMIERPHSVNHCCKSNSYGYLYSSLDLPTLNNTAIYYAGFCLYRPVKSRNVFDVKNIVHVKESQFEVSYDGLRFDKTKRLSKLVNENFSPVERSYICSDLYSLRESFSIYYFIMSFLGLIKPDSKNSDY